MRRLLRKVFYSALCILVHQVVAAQSYLPEYNDQRFKVKPVILMKAYAFDLKDVQLLNGPFKDAMLADERYLLSIDPDRLLSGFRSHSGLKPKAAIYEGWESSGLAGHTLGHYLSALSLLYASSHSNEVLNRVNYIVTQLHDCQVARKTGYIGAIPKEDTIWREVGNGNIRSRGFDLNGGWSPWYTVHKVFAGLLDAYLYTNNQQALNVAERLADWAGKILANLNDEQIQNMLLCEYGGMAETLANLYAITGNKKYLGLSYKFYDKKILDPLANDQDILPGKHSNTQIPKVIASARRYEITNDKRDNAIAGFFWKTVVNHHSYATGGNSNYEYLGDADKLNDQLTESTTETCNTYNMLKLTRHLFATEPSATLMDYYEKALYNHILTSQNHQDGMMCYFVSLRMGGRKEYSTPFTTFTCCVGSGMENHVKYNESIYFRGSDGSIYVNLFIPSVLNYRDKKLTLKQESALPQNGNINYTINTAKPVYLPIKIRKPAWSQNVAILVNGKKLPLTIDDEGYIVLTRKWKNNDKIELKLAENIYTEAMPDNINRKAIFYGPFLLAGILGDTEPDPVNGVPVMVTNNADPGKWLQVVNDQKFAFNAGYTSQPAGIKLLPFNTIKDEYYTVYWDVFSPETWAVQKKAYDEEKKTQQQLEAKTTDLLRPGEMQPERDHNLTGEKIITGEDHLHKWRSTDENGYFSYTMKVDGNLQNTLINMYWGMDNRGRKFDIWIDDVKLTSEDLNKYKQSRFYYIAYPIPIELTKGKNRVTVKLTASSGNSAGPLYGSRMVKN